LPPLGSKLLGFYILYATLSGFSITEKNFGQNKLFKNPFSRPMLLPEELDKYQRD
jgi:hypothetical protein